MSKSHKVWPRKKVGIVRVSGEEGFRIRLIPDVQETINKTNDQTKLEFVRLILNNIEANLMIDFGLAEIGDDSDETENGL